MNSIEIYLLEAFIVVLTLVMAGPALLTWYQERKQNRAKQNKKQQ